MQFFSGISLRLVKVSALIALFVSILLSVVQISPLFLERQDDVSNILYRLSLINAATLSKSLQGNDQLLISNSLKEFIDYTFVDRVAIRDGSSRVHTFLEQTPIKTSTLWFTKFLFKPYYSIAFALTDGAIIDVSADDLARSNSASDDQHDFNNTFGGNTQSFISVTINRDMAFQAVYQKSMYILLSNMLYSFLLVSLLLLTCYRILIKPLASIIKEMSDIEPTKNRACRLVYPQDQRSGELNELVSIGNHWLQMIDTVIEKRSAVSDVLGKSEENIRQIIDSLPVCVGARNIDGYYIFANKALADFMGLKPETVRGAHLDQFDDVFVGALKNIKDRDQKTILHNKIIDTYEETWRDQEGVSHQMHTHTMPMTFYDDTVVISVSSDISELKSTQALMEHMAFHDELTGLPNRNYLIEYLEKQIVSASRDNIYGALLFIDLDQFKQVNDSLGHSVGDILLQHVAERLLSSVSEKDVVVRLGGDEFIVVLVDSGDDLSLVMNKVEQTAQRIRNYVSQPHMHNDIELYVTCSIGIALFPEENAGVDELLSYADTAMYYVKGDGRNGIRFFNKHMADSAKSAFLMEGDLHKAVDQRGLSLHYQPRVDSATGEIVGAEALLRWQHPKNGLISPAEFIPVLEASGLIVDVGLWVLEESIEQVKQWQAAGLWDSNMYLGVNISPRQFRSPDFVNSVREILNRQNFSGCHLEMEITEGIVIHNFVDTVNRMKDLRKLGVRFALDDFGTGYSSISYLKKLPVSVLKIDQSFIGDIVNDRYDRILVETISAMGNMLELQIVAEGVENTEQLALIKQYGCGFYQGYLRSKPLISDGFTQLLKKENRHLECDLG